MILKVKFYLVSAETGIFMVLWKIKKFVYMVLVDNHPLISREYAYFQDAHKFGQGRCGKLLCILRLNWKYRICRKELEESLDRLPMPESMANELPSAAELARQLAGYDVVSFDVFDTLIFRAVEQPTDVFRLLEGKWKQIGFASQRKLAEQRARTKKQEITISDIYDILVHELSFAKEDGIAGELEMESEVCYANPYMYEVYRLLLQQGKTVIAASDMYIPHDEMERLLSGCGYSSLSRIYVSCDYGAGKGAGRLQTLIRQEMGLRRSYIHVGDNMRSDLLGSRQAGWDAFYYPNIHKCGYPYRRREMASLAASFYKGLTNGRLHSGAPCGDAYYQYGYAYGGIMAMGYCQYIEGLAQQEGIDQFLFVARDGYILDKVYSSFFHKIDTAYVPFSRLASYQITMERNWRNFLQYVVKPRIHAQQEETLGEVMRICGMEYLEKYFGQYGLECGMGFGRDVYHRVEQVFEEHIGDILQYYTRGERAAEKYFADIIKDHKKVCVVDIGWAGTSIACLRFFLEEKCGMDIQVCGALMGMCANESAKAGLDTGRMHSYMFSAEQNHENLIRHTGRQNELDFRNLLVEILFTEDRPTFMGFGMDENGAVELKYGAKENNGKMIAGVQQGIYDFSRDFYHYSKKFPEWLKIRGQEAYLPLHGLAEAKRYCIKLLGDYEIHENAGCFEADKKRLFKDIVKIL